jgi:hypothetical protein
MGAVLRRRAYEPPPQEGLRAWRSPSRGVVSQSFGESPPDFTGDWEEIEPPHEWDHDHCEFCWATFSQKGTDDPSILQEGYATEDDEWICDRCFADFRDEFNWTVADPPHDDPA